MDRGILIFLVVIILLAAGFITFRACNRPDNYCISRVEFSFRNDTVKTVGEALKLDVSFPESNFKEDPETEWFYSLEGTELKYNITDAQRESFRFESAGKYRFVFKMKACDTLWTQSVLVSEPKSSIWGFISENDDLSKPLKKNTPISFTATCSKDVDTTKLVWINNGKEVAKGATKVSLTPKREGKDSISLFYDEAPLKTLTYSVEFEENKSTVVVKKPKPPTGGVICGEDTFEVNEINSAVVRALREYTARVSNGENAAAFETYKELKHKYFCNSTNFPVTYKGETFPNLEALTQKLKLSNGTASVTSCSVTPSKGLVSKLTVN